MASSSVPVSAAGRDLGILVGLSLSGPQWLAVDVSCMAPSLESCSIQGHCIYYFCCSHLVKFMVIRDVTAALQACKQASLGDVQHPEQLQCGWRCKSSQTQTCKLATHLLCVLLPADACMLCVLWCLQGQIPLCLPTGSICNGQDAAH